MAHNAPGKHYREGISLKAVFKMFPDSDTAEAWFAERRWGGTPACPHCGSLNVQSGCKHKTMKYRCREKLCGKRFSVKVGTIMEGSNLDYQTWAIAMYLMVTNLKGISSMKLHRELDITQKSAWHLAHRLRKSLQTSDMPFFGPVEVDEAYLGGKRKNMSNAKRKRLAEDLPGRGAVGKTAVAGIKDRASGHVRAQVVPMVDGKTLREFIDWNADSEATVYTDDSTAYSGLNRPHETVKHSVSEYVNGMASTNGIESFWALLKRGYHGTFHHFSEKHADRYINEFAGRFNLRERDTVDIFKAVTRGMEGKRLRYRELVA